jgi:hypothetical protein
MDRTDEPGGRATLPGGYALRGVPGLRAAVVVASALLLVAACGRTGTTADVATGSPGLAATDCLNAIEQVKAHQYTDGSTVAERTTELVARLRQTGAAAADGQWRVSESQPDAGGPLNCLVSFEYKTHGQSNSVDWTYNPQQGKARPLNILAGA